MIKLLHMNLNFKFKYNMIDMNMNLKIKYNIIKIQY